MTSAICAEKMDHVALMVSDLERSFHFYHEVLGLENRAESLAPWVGR